MDKPFCLYIDRLKEGQTELLYEQIPAKNFHDDCEEVRFTEDVLLKGQAYVTDDYLIVDCTISTHVDVPCSVCNLPFSLPIEIDCMHEEALEDIKGGIFDYLHMVQEEIFLEIPHFLQCGKTECQNREEIEKYIHKKQAAEEGEDEYHPFRDVL